MGIDLTKYEGHTPGPWRWDGPNRLDSLGFPVLEAADDGKSYGMHEAEIRHHYDPDSAKPNDELIADAPALLAEVVRLRADLADAVAALKHYVLATPSDFDMESGMEAQCIAQLCDAYDRARAVLAKHGGGK